jgi:hypothetical protein
MVSAPGGSDPRVIFCSLLLLLQSWTQISAHHAICEHLNPCSFLNMKLKISHPREKQVQRISRYSYFEIAKERQWMEWKVSWISWVHPALNFFMNVILILWCSSHVFVHCCTFERFITVLRLWRFSRLLLRRRVDVCMFVCMYVVVSSPSFRPNRLPAFYKDTLFSVQRVGFRLLN